MNTTNNDILDDFNHQKEIILHSKLSIAILSIILSPITASILYSLNLWKTNQKEKIMGTLTAIAVSYLFLLLPILGFSMNDLSITELGLHNIVLLLFIIHPLWKKHFDDFEYTTKHNWLLTTGIITAWFLYTYIYHSLFPINYFHSPSIIQIIIRPSNINLVLLIFCGLIIKYLTKIIKFIYAKNNNNKP